MGLFSRKPKNETPEPAGVAPAVDLQAELEAVNERLKASEQARADLEARLGLLDKFNATLNGRISTIDGATSLLDARLDALDQGVALVGDQLTAVSSTSASLDQRLIAFDDLDERLRELTDRLNTPISAPPPSPSAPPPPPPPSTSIASPPPPPPTAVRFDDERLDDLALQLDALAAAVAAHTERMSSVDGRVTSVSTELANQLTELSRDIDDLNRRGAEQADGESHPGNVDTAEIEARLTERLDAAIDDVLDTTEKLAAEQARYEIQFRADLAELAERLRRPNAS